MTPSQPTQLTLPNYPTYPTPTNPTYHTHHYLTPYPPPNSPHAPYMCLPRNPQTLSYSQVTANNRPTNTQTRNNWRASVASETLTGVKMKKSGMFVYLFIYMDVCMSFCTLTLRIFVFAPRSTPSQTSLNRILRFSDHYPYHPRN